MSTAARQTSSWIASSVSLMTTRDWRPRYLQVAEDLRKQILDGALQPGDPMPSEATMSKTYSLSRTSIRGAIRQLREWGLVRAEQGRGTYVRAARQRVTRTPERYQWEKDRARMGEDQRRREGATEYDTGRPMHELVFTAEYLEIPADPDLAEAFGVEIGTPLLERRFRTRTQDELGPLALVRSWLPHAIAAKNEALLDAANEPWPGGTQHQLKTVGVEIDRITDRVLARPPSPDEAIDLDIDPGVAILALRKTSIDTKGGVVEVSDVVLAGDRTELVYTTTLERWTKP